MLQSNSGLKADVAKCYFTFDCYAFFLLKYFVQKKCCRSDKFEIWSDRMSDRI